MTTSQPEAKNASGTFWLRLARRYRMVITPNRQDDLPSLRVLLAFPALLLIAGILLIGSALNGTSSGQYYGQVHSGRDPALIAGRPEAIRSDEWNVAVSWSISQVQQGLPERNETFPGGMDAAIPQDLPRLDWSVAFRPHLVGYLFLDINRAYAWKWWLPALALLAAAYCFLVTVLPRRPGVAAALSIGFYFSPFFQWWFLPSTLWPATWALATMASLVWAIKSTSTRARWIWAIVIGYLTVVMAMGLYVPFIIPVVLIIPLFTIGLLVERWRHGERMSTLVRRILPTLLAGGGAASITALWLHSKAATVDAFLSTDYPGERLSGTGSSDFLTLARTVSSTFSEALRRDAGFLGTNSSEASTFFLIGAFLLPVVCWAIYRMARQGRPLPWTLIGTSSAILLFVAFAFVPGWDLIAHVIFLDRSTDSRIRIGLGVASLAVLAYLVRFLDDTRTKPKRIISFGTAALFLLSQVAIAGAVSVVGGPGKLEHAAPFWWAYAIVSAGAIYFFSRRRVLLGTVAFFLVTVLSSITVNPVYRGVFDLRQTAPAKAIMKLDAQQPGAWVGIGTSLTTGMLLESGVRAYNGVQGAPPAKMWRQIDPAQKYKFEWNRLAGVGWVSEPGPPRVSNSAPDQIVVTFDACSAFAQKYISYVLTNEPSVPASCLMLEKRFTLPKSTVEIFRVVPKK